MPFTLCGSDFEAASLHSVIFLGEKEGQALGIFSAQQVRGKGLEETEYVGGDMIE